MREKVNKVHPFDPQEIEKWKAPVALIINCLDPETDWQGASSLDVEDDEQGNFVGIGIYNAHANVCYYWSDWELAKRLTIPKFVAHNGVSDIHKLQKWGFKVDESNLLWDTQLFQHILDSSQHDYGLKSICKREGIGEWPIYEEICGKKTSKEHKTLKDFPVEAVAEYNACDTYYTYKLYEKQKDSLRIEVDPEKAQYFPDWTYFTNVEKPVSFIFKRMEEQGIRVDLDYLRELQTYLEDQREPLIKEIKNELGDINLNSPRQLLEALHAKEIYPEFKGKASTDKRALERLKNNRIVSYLLQFSELETLLTSFVYPYLERNVDTVRPWFNQVGTRTGRPSCSNPNLLQIPKKTENGRLVRNMFVAREGYEFGELDYKNGEPRMWAHFSQDPALCEMFSKGIDFHTYTAEKMQIDRDKAKVLNLSVGYLATFKSVAQQLKCTDSEAQREIDKWWNLFPGLKNWQDKLIWQSKKDGYLTTLMGRRIKVEGLNEYNKWKREHAQRVLVNNISQSSLGECIKLAMIPIYKSGTHILVQVYDSLLIETLKKLNRIELQSSKDIMSRNSVVSVPLEIEVKVGDRWGSLS